MLIKIKENLFRIDLTVRDYFTFQIDFENQRFILTYCNRTLNSEVSKFYMFESFLGNDPFKVSEKDYQEIIKCIQLCFISILHENFISNPMYRELNRFKNDLLNYYNQIVLYNFKL